MIHTYNTKKKCICNNKKNIDNIVDNIYIKKEQKKKTKKKLLGKKKV